MLPAYPKFSFEARQESGNIGITMNKAGYCTPALSVEGSTTRLALPLQAGPCLLIAAAILVCGFGARAADTSIYSIVTNPGEDCSHQMNIGWHADPGCTNCFGRVQLYLDWRLPRPLSPLGPAEQCRKGAECRFGD